MNCPTCEGATRRFGHNRSGSQRYRCDRCRKTFTDNTTLARDRRDLPRAKAIMVLKMLLEGVSVRSTERLTGVHRDTILEVLVDAGERCGPFLERVVRGLEVKDVQADEIWGFVGCKEKTRVREGYSEAVGDAWCFVAIERNCKLVLTWHLDKRTPDATRAFAVKLREATSGRFQLSTDGFTPYRTAIPDTFGDGLDFAQLIKVYGTPADQGSAARYSPGEVIDTHATVRTGNPDEDSICTSHAERANLTMRMTIRRLTRLTNAHSKKWANHWAALAVYFCYYNFCRPHQTLTEGIGQKCTPAMAAGLTERAWTVGELLQNAA